MIKITLTLPNLSTATVEVETVQEAIDFLQTYGTQYPTYSIGTAPFRPDQPA